MAGVRVDNCVCHLKQTNAATYREETCLDPVAVVGMGCRLPGGVSNPSELWNLLRCKRTGFQEFGPDRVNIDGFYHPDYQRPGSIHTRGGCLLQEDPKLFDYTFFGMTIAEVMTMDPLQRKLLEVTYEAFENAGEPWDKFSGSSTGVFVGNFNSDHSIMQMYDIDFPLPYASTGGGASTLSNRINHIFNLRGPSLTIDTACASSMTALHLAVNAIRNGDCESAIVAGSNLVSAPEMQMLTVKLGALSPTSKCHTFDSSADGYGRAEGFATLYLKKYSDAVAGGFPVRAIIRGTAINANGRTAGISHPSAEGQEALIRQAYRSAGLSPDTTGYFECHGTGTPVGDPIEISAIGRVFGAARKVEPLLIGSVKTNLGHSESASGIVGVMKVILALEKGEIPPTLGLKNLNPQINFDEAGVQVVTEMTQWPSDLPRRASVNSFGYGGANAHCILDHESAFLADVADIPSTYKLASIQVDGHASLGRVRLPEVSTLDRVMTPTTDRESGRFSDLNSASHPQDVHAVSTRRLVLLPFSAHSEPSLRQNMLQIQRAIPKNSLSDIAYTLSTRRSKFAYKAFSIVDSRNPTQGVSEAETFAVKPFYDKPRIAFIFTGQGAQWQKMGCSLFGEYEVFRNSIRLQDLVLKKLSFSPSWTLQEFFSQCLHVDVHSASISQTVCTALQIALVDLLQSWAISPEVVAGHSSGEIAAAYTAGCLSRGAAIITAFCRGRAVARNSRQGLMLAVGLGAHDAALLLKGPIENKVSIAAVNSSSSVTLSGDIQAIHELRRRFQNDGIFTKVLQTNNNAYHSHHMLRVGEEYELFLSQGFDELAAFEYNDSFESCQRPGVQWISSVSSSPPDVGSDTARKSGYWRQNLESQVRFSAAIEAVLRKDVDILIEIGSHSVLKGPIQQTIADAATGYGTKPTQYLPTLKRHDDGMSNMLTLCGMLFCMNYPVDVRLANSLDNASPGQNGLSFTHNSVCTDLPTYRYDYGPPIYHENRIGREIKGRRHLRHDLLGALQPGGTKNRPAWRNILRMKDVPWLKDHQLLPDTVMPASGYVCLAIEAASQYLGETSSDVCFMLRSIAFKVAMVVPDDDHGLEMMLNMHQSSHSPNSLDFTVSSVHGVGDNWTEHASGSISRISASRRGPQQINTKIDARVIDVEGWYQKFTEVGLGYGKSFRGISDLLSDPQRNVATAKVDLNTSAGMFQGPESSYCIHPASLDVCHQLALIACYGGQVGRVKTAFVPVFIDEMTVWNRQNDDTWGQAVAIGQPIGLRGAHASVELFDQAGHPRLVISNLRCLAHHGGRVSPLAAKKVDTPDPYLRLVWKPDITELSFNNAKRLFPPAVASEAVQMSFDGVEMMSRHMVVHLASEYEPSEAEDPILRRFLDWAHRLARVELEREGFERLTKEDRLQAIERLYDYMGPVVDAKHIKRIFDNIPSILAGTKTGVEVARQDEYLVELYASGVGIAAAYPQLSRLLDLVSHRNPSMKILEVGSGTGGATRVALQALGASTTSKRYSSYTFTDVSSAFLEKSQTEFANCHDVVYKTLDLNVCPSEQGFEQEYDLVIASECLHAAKNISMALRNVRKLLKTGAKLIFLETTRTVLAHGIAYGTFPEWWKDSDGIDSPFLSLEQWHQELIDTGFSGIDIELDDYEAPFKLVSTVFTTVIEQQQPPEQKFVSLPSGEEIYIIFHSISGGLHEALSSELKSNGLNPILMPIGECEIPFGGRVIFTGDLETHMLLDGDEMHFEQIKDLARRARSILWITAGGMLEGHDPKAALATGLIRMLITENPLSNYGIFHLQPSIAASAATARQIVTRESLIHTGDSETELAQHEGNLYISRLILDSALNSRFRSQQTSVPTLNTSPVRLSEPMCVDFEVPGLLTSLYFRTDDIHQNSLKNDWIQVETHAIGLNWKDLAVSAGRLDMNFFSSECAGIVTRCGSSVEKLRPGDRVYGLAWSRFSTSVRCPAAFAQKMAPHETFANMATIPIVFCSAIYALIHLARLRKGESVLIQSATGGLGLAAINIAQHIGAVIFATVGGDDKARHLHDKYHIPSERIFSSRDVVDIPSMRLATKGRGFDVILNSSHGDVMQETSRLIAPRGRFIDVGRVDVQNHGSLAMEIFARNATFSSFDLSVLAVQDPAFCSALMEEVNNMVREAIIKPITPTQIYDVSKLDQSLLDFSKGRHIGKIVVTYEESESKVKMLPPSPEARFDPEAEYIIAGGLGGLGRSILQWMVRRGARNITVLSRSGRQSLSTHASSMLSDFATQDIHVHVRKCDVTVKEDVDATIRATNERRAIKGLFHAAAVLVDRLFDTLPYAQWKLGLAAKVQGTLNLHYASISHDLKLDFFIMTSSFEAVVAMPTQAAYCAGNSFQDAFARYRLAQGLPASAIAFGLITEIGEFGQRAITRNMIHRNGLYPTGELKFLELLEAAFLPTPEWTGTSHDFDPLAQSQITTCLEPTELAAMEQVQSWGTAEAPRWYSDKKFSHVIQAMRDATKSVDRPHVLSIHPREPTLTIDEAIRDDCIEEAGLEITQAIVRRMAKLLAIAAGSVEVNKSVADYGVDSLIAVELRSWVILQFDSNLPLLKLLDEKVSIRDLGLWLASERRDRMETL